MNNKQVNVNISYTASPLRRKSVAAAKTPRVSIAPAEIIVNDDEAERLHRRRRESALFTSTPLAANRRQSITSTLSHLNANQLQQKLLECIQLNTENKITLKNAFSLPAIDIITYFVKMDTEPDLQVASSSLDVSSKVYSLRVDKVYMEVFKMCSNLGKKNDSIIDDEANELEDIPAHENDENELINEKKKKKKRNRTKLTMTVEALKGSPDVISLDAATCNQDDPQTTDVLHQIKAVFQVKEDCYMHNFDAPVLDSLDTSSKINDTYYSTDMFDSLTLQNSQLSVPFKFLDWSEENELEDESHLDQEIEISSEEQANIFHFDIDELPDSTPFPSQDVHMEASVTSRNECQKQNNNDGVIEDFCKSLRLNADNKVSEYSYVPHNLIHFNVPTHWKIVKPKNLCASKNEPCAQQRKKKLVQIDFENDEDINSKFIKGSRVKCLESTFNSWDEDKILSNNVISEIDERCLFQCFTQIGYYIKIMPKCVEEVTGNADAVERNDFGDDHGTEADMDLDHNDFHDHVSDVDQIVNNSDLLTQGALTGSNLVNAPDMVENIFIPYSKKAKKIDVHQVKKSMMTYLKAHLNTSFVDTDNQNESMNHSKKKRITNPVSFGEMYTDLPKLLSKANVESMSVPIAFVSLLHLANEETLYIESSEFRDDLTINQ